VTALVELPPAGVVPSAVRPAIAFYEHNPAARSELVAAVDREGHQWEHAIATRAVETRAELVATCRRLVELHDGLVELHAAERWLRGFPFRSSWRPEPYGLYVCGHRVGVLEILGVIEDTCQVDGRLHRIARRPPPRDPPYEPPPPPNKYGPAQNALAAAGATLNDVAELMPASESAVSRWLTGNRPWPDRLGEVLEDLIGEADAVRVLALIPSPDRQEVEPTE
jgi:hypothetical protein